MSKRIHAKAALLMLAAATAGVSFAPAAGATPVTYDFTVTYNPGGTVTGSATGSFSYDSSSVVAGKTVTGEHLLTALDYTIGGVAYTIANTHSAFLQFGADGALLDFAFGSTSACSANGCAVPATGAYWYINDPTLSFYNPGAPRNLGAGKIPSFVLVKGPVPVPEPGSLGLFGVGAVLGGLFLGVRRRMA